MQRVRYQPSAQFMVLPSNAKKRSYCGAYRTPRGKYVPTTTTWSASGYPRPTSGAPQPVKVASAVIVSINVIKRKIIEFRIKASQKEIPEHKPCASTCHRLGGYFYRE